MSNSSTHTLFIADIHLDESTPCTTLLFEKFMTEQALEADTLYILGDLFEAWIGDDHNTPFIQRIKSIIKHTANQIPVYFMRGNRDFLLGKRFAKETNTQRISDPTVITLYDKKLLLMHGDSLCLKDKTHQIYRRIIQHPLVTGIGQYLPLSLRQRIGRQLRQRSGQHMRSTDPTFLDVDPTAVTTVLAQNNTKTLIHGHTHRPKMHQIEINGAPAERIVLASWHKRGQALKWYADGKKEFIHIDA